MKNFKFITLFGSLNLREPAATKRILDHYDKEPEFFASIRYDYYLAYDPSAPQVDQPDTWVIALLGRSGGYLIPQSLNNRYLRAFLLGMSLGFVIVVGCIVWLFLAGLLPNSVVGVMIAGVALLIGPVAAGSATSWPVHRRIVKDFQRIKFPDELARAIAAIDEKKARKNAG